MAPGVLAPERVRPPLGPVLGGAAALRGLFRPGCEDEVAASRVRSLELGMANSGPVGHLSPPWDTLSPRPRAPGRGHGPKATQPFRFPQQRHFPLHKSQPHRGRTVVSATSASSGFFRACQLLRTFVFSVCLQMTK